MQLSTDKQEKMKKTYLKNDYEEIATIEKNKQMKCLNRKY